jgi:hypothetical protein
MKALFLMMSVFFFLAVTDVGAGQMYRWVDETGKIWIVDDISQVPKPYRNKVKRYPASSRPKKTASPQEKAVPESPPEVPEVRPETEAPAPAAEDDRARVRVLLQEKETLEQERMSQKILERRFGRKGGVSTGSRATFYQKRVEEIDKEIETVQEDLDEILSKSP